MNLLYAMSLLSVDYCHIKGGWLERLGIQNLWDARHHRIRSSSSGHGSDSQKFTGKVHRESRIIISYVPIGSIPILELYFPPYALSFYDLAINHRCNCGLLKLSTRDFSTVPRFNT